ncbi:MAG TPA: helix-turn-helix transcriptional regulator [Acidimicrobiia bacterium]|jgi:transcriptional regulator with XRE-family HTH domain|nr:helix-turn-helix transcriptional regulator [Acidimicrobiia bacterium]
MGKKLVTPGDYIHARRRDLAITKGQAARMAGLTDGQWRDIEDGLRPPTDETLASVARVLRVDAAALKRRYG